MAANQQDRNPAAPDPADQAGIEDAEAGAPQLGDAEEAMEIPEASNEAEPAGDDGGSDNGEDDELESLRAELSEARDQVIRAQAETQNIRRRAERDVENANKFAVEKFSSALVPVIDNLERALALMDVDDEQVRPLLEGIELTHRSFLDVLRRFAIEVVDPVGEPFDPACHEAMSVIENDEVEPNTVVQVVQKGYTLNGRVLRAAMVLVSRPQARVDETA